jgi:hypothetical protein
VTSNPRAGQNRLKKSKSHRGKPVDKTQKTQWKFWAVDLRAGGQQGTNESAKLLLTPKGKRRGEREFPSRETGRKLGKS